MRFSYGGHIIISSWDNEIFSLRSYLHETMRFSHGGHITISPWDHESFSWRSYHNISMRQWDFLMEVISPYLHETMRCLMVSWSMRPWDRVRNRPKVHLLPIHPGWGLKLNRKATIFLWFNASCLKTRQAGIWNIWLWQSDMSLTLIRIQTKNQISAVGLLIALT